MRRLRISRRPCAFTELTGPLGDIFNIDLDESPYEPSETRPPDSIGPELQSDLLELSSISSTLLTAVTGIKDSKAISNLLADIMLVAPAFAQVNGRPEKIVDYLFWFFIELRVNVKRGVPIRKIRDIQFGKKSREALHRLYLTPKGRRDKKALLRRLKKDLTRRQRHR